ncbi:SGNH/GDSL hydrolase family protein [Nocardia sp. NBC_01009]|uniref:SGNH/GDSL hydrolase family protein n=1 Tax=Nocardia sp. NBC_01009 TaxID=2975996 RepID=UPI00386DF482|nr:SGNH/GDSL hydrolase family protein [Nocardia sp. NBC_01009]
MKKVSRVLIACAAVCVTLPVVSESASATPSRFDEYVALGDSWAADATLNPGLVTEEFVPLTCAQSRGSYAKQVAAALAVAVFRDASCGGAQTVDMTGSQKGLNPPQFDRLTPSTDLVTLLIGGNDAGLAAAVQGCPTLDPGATPCLDSFVVDGVDRMSASIAAAEPKVVATIEGVRARAPHARVLVLNYFKGVGTEGSCFPAIPISDRDARWVGRKLVELNAMVARAVEATGVELVDTYAASDGHDACQPAGVRWAEGLVPFSSAPVGPAVPFHPNQLGADHQARSVLAAVGR